MLAYDARGHGTSGGEITLAGPREVADLRALRNAFAARPEVNDTIGAWGISYGGGQIWNALAAGVPLAAAEVVETWTSLYDALWSQGLARSGIVAGFAASIAARSPLVAGIRDDAVQSRNLGAVRTLAQPRSAAGRIGSITTPVYLFQGRVDFAFDITQAAQGFASLRGPKKLYVGNFGHTPSTFPGADVQYVLAQAVAWFDRHLKRTAERRRRGEGRAREAGLGHRPRHARRLAEVDADRRTSSPAARSPPGTRSSRAALRRCSRRSRRGAWARSTSTCRSLPAIRVSSSPCSPATASSATAA